MEHDNLLYGLREIQDADGVTVTYARGDDSLATLVVIRGNEESVYESSDGVRTLITTQYVDLVAADLVLPVAGAVDPRHGDTVAIGSTTFAVAGDRPFDTFRPGTSSAVYRVYLAERG